MSESVQEVNWVRKRISGERWIFLLLLIPIIIHLYMHLVFSRSRAYEQIQLGMRVGDVRDLLRKENVWCGGRTSPVIVPDGGSICQFEDPWREYFIALDPKSGEVVTKQVTYKPVLLLPSRAVRLLFGRIRI